MRRAVAVLAISAVLSPSSVSAYGADSSSPEYSPGVTVTADEDSPTGYPATFVYQSSDPGIEKVVIYSDTFLLWDAQAPQYTGGSGLNLNAVTPADRAAYGHLPQEFDSTLWPGGGSASTRHTVELTHIPEEGVGAHSCPS